MTPQSLKNDKEYTVPGKCIYWILGKHTLDLEVILDWAKYEGGGLSLPPPQLGICKDWHFEISDTDSTGSFSASWSIRRVKDKLELIDNVNETITPYAIDEDLF